MIGLIAVGYFLFTVFFSLLTFVLWTRIALRYFHVSSLHPVSQAITGLTNPIITPIAHLLSLTKTRSSRYDWPCFLLLIVVEFIKFMLIFPLFFGAMLPWIFVPIYIVADLIVQPCDLLFYAVVIRVIMSWVNPRWQHPLADILRLVTEPLFRLGRRIIPDISGFDFSPFLVMILLKVITRFISASLPMQLM